MKNTDNHVNDENVEDSSSVDIPTLTRADIVSALRRPHQCIDLILTRRLDLARTIGRGDALLLLIGLLFAVSAIFTVPYAGVLDIRQPWRIAVLFLGALTICFPSLHVTSAYLGFQLNLTQNMVLSLLITSVASLFCFSFFPILWFLSATTALEEHSFIGAEDLSNVLLGVSLLAGLAHHTRTIRTQAGLLQNGLVALITLWQFLLLFITYRMAKVLELL